MTMCINGKHSCVCQPDDGMPCPYPDTQVAPSPPPQDEQGRKGNTAGDSGESSLQRGTPEEMPTKSDDVADELRGLAVNGGWAQCADAMFKAADHIDHLRRQMAEQESTIARQHAVLSARYYAGVE